MRKLSNIVGLALQLDFTVLIKMALRGLLTCIFIFIMKLDKTLATDVSATTFTKSSASCSTYRQVMSYTQVQRPLHCASLCDKNQDCMAFYYDRDSQGCALVSTNTAFSTIPTQTCAWTFYRGPVTCLYNYAQAYNKCFKACTTKRSWSSARSTCRSLGGDILVLDTSSFFYYIRDYLLANQAVTNFWVGAYKDVDGSFRWVDSSSTEVAFYKWGSNQPDNYYGNEDCVAFLSNVDTMFNDLPCSATEKFLCEFPV